MSHSLLSPSGAKRWTRCTISPFLIREANPPDKSSVYADEGTQAHGYGEATLRRFIKTGALDYGDTPPNFLPHIKTYVEECISHIKLEHGKPAKGQIILVENKVPLFYMPQDRGTIDFCVLSVDGVVINDLKYGMGVRVEAEGNEQLAIYAMSMLTQLDEDGIFSCRPETPVSIRITQPRYVGASPVSVWDTTAGELAIFLKTVKTQAENITHALATNDHSKLKYCVEDDVCRWCPIKKDCAERARQTVGCMPDYANPLNLPVPLDDDTRFNMLRMAKQIRAVLDENEEVIEERLQSGESIPWAKLVKGRAGNRAYANEAIAGVELESRLGQDAYTKSLLSPAKAEEACKAKGIDTKFIDDIVTRSEPKLVVALATDKRPAQTPVGDWFQNLEETEDQP